MIRSRQCMLFKIWRIFSATVLLVGCYICSRWILSDPEVYCVEFSASDVSMGIILQCLSNVNVCVNQTKLKIHFGFTKITWMLISFFINACVSLEMAITRKLPGMYTAQKICIWWHPLNSIIGHVHSVESAKWLLNGEKKRREKLNYFWITSIYCLAVYPKYGEKFWRWIRCPSSTIWQKSDDKIKWFDRKKEKKTLLLINRVSVITVQA